MMRQGILALLLPGVTMAVVLAQSASVPNAPSAAYQFQVPGSDVDRRAVALLADMTLAEKVGQMTQVDILALADKQDITRLAIGSLLSGGTSDPPDITASGWASAVDDYQSYALRTRLRIPLLYGIDAVHGHNNVDGAVIFPHNIALGATRDAALVERVARASAEEVAGTGIQWTFAPATIVSRDERWGRTYESFGEDPSLVSQLGAAAVRGWQSRKLDAPTATLACAKHFVGDGGTEGGRDQGNTVCDEATLRRLYLPPYEAAVRAGVGSIMVSFSSWNGTKMHANTFLLTDVLKGELGFRGFLVSDWAAIDQLPGDFRTQIETAINAGLDMIMIPNGPGKANSYVEFIDLLTALVRNGRVPMARVDDAVLRILRVKLEMNLGARTKSDRALTAKVGAEEHRMIARESVRQSLVLLKNDNRALPLSPSARRIHVVGPAADDIAVQCGGWTIGWQGIEGKSLSGGTTILAALRRAMTRGAQITFDAGGAGSDGADAVVVVVGEPPYAEMKGDREDLGLPGGTIEALRRARASRAPVVLVVLSGRPLVLGEALALSDAVVAAWLPGTEGDGVADVLIGRYAPTGKLPMSWPRSTAQVPINVGDAQYDPLFPFGFWLTYPSERRGR